MRRFVRACQWFVRQPVAEQWRLAGQFRRHAAAHGWREALRRAAAHGPAAPAQADAYAAWCAVHTPDAGALARMREQSAGFPYRPLITILTPVYNTDPRWLAAAADSVLAQVYPHWQWSVGNDGSTSAGTLAALSRLAARDPRILVTHAPANGGISAATNMALARADGEWVALMDSDDALLPHALFRIVAHLNGPGGRPDVVYSDEDKLDVDGRRCDAYFKPDWSPELFMSNMYVCHLLAARRALVEEVGGFRSQFDFSQDYDLMLRLMERATRIDHVPDILYHWRKLPQSGAAMADAKPAAHVAGRAALQDALARRGLAGAVEDAGPAGFYRVRCRLPALLVSVMHADRAPLAPPALPPGVRVEYPPALEAARGDVLVWVDAGVTPIGADWLEALLEVVTQPGVGVAAPRVLGPDGRLREVGLTLGGDTLATRHLWGLPRAHGGYFGSGLTIRNVSAAGGACLASTRETWDAAGGWDGLLADHDARAIDYCLRVEATGRRVVVTPWSSVTAAAAAREVVPPAADRARLLARWGDRLAADPYWSAHASTIGAAGT